MGTCRHYVLFGALASIDVQSLPGKEVTSRLERLLAIVDDIS